MPYREKVNVQLRILPMRVIWAIQTLNDLQGLIAFSISARTVRVWETDTAKFVDVSTQSWMGADD